MKQDPCKAQGTCLLRIQAALPCAGSAEKRLGEFILARPHDAVQCTIGQLQERSGASYATVNRFCRHLGYSGYKELRKALIESIAGAAAPIIESTGVAVNPADTVETITAKVFSSTAALLQETRAILDTAMMDAAVRAINQASHVCFAGTGTSALVARYALTRFFRIGINCSAESDTTLTRQRAALLDRCGVLFAISSSGRSRPVVEAAAIAAGNGATIISLCDYAVSPLSRLAPVNLYTTPRNAGSFRDREMPLICGQIALIDVLFAACCVKGKSAQKIRAIYEATKKAADSEKLAGRKT